MSLKKELACIQLLNSKGAYNATEVYSMSKEDDYKLVSLWVKLPSFAMITAVNEAISTDASARPLVACRSATQGDACQSKKARTRSLSKLCDIPLIANLCYDFPKQQDI